METQSANAQNNWNTMNTTNKHSFEVCQRFYFDAAHRLNREIEIEGSRRIHGHTYIAEVVVRGEVNTKTGMVVDIGLIRLEIDKVRERLDHHYLDEVPDLGIPTLENLCVYIEKAMRNNRLQLSRVSVWRESLGDRCDMTVNTA
jgi:6-pyruvoyltetrahydropterin/6-carboxytetrahydropterin synthase